MITDPTISFNDYKISTILWLIFTQNVDKLCPYYDMEPSDGYDSFFKFIINNNTIPPKWLFIFQNSLQVKPKIDLIQLCLWIVSGTLMAGIEIHHHVVMFLTIPDKLDEDT